MTLRLVAVALLCGPLVWGCRLFEEAKIPLELQGVWTTSDPRFEGRSLVLKENVVIFETEPDRKSINVVTAVAQQRQDHQTVYTIRYRTQADQEFALSLSYDPEQRIVQLTNRPDVRWTRKTGAVVPPSAMGSVGV